MQAVLDLGHPAMFGRNRLQLFGEMLVLDDCSYISCTVAEPPNSFRAVRAGHMISGAGEVSCRARQHCRIAAHRTSRLHWPVPCMRWIEDHWTALVLLTGLLTVAVVVIKPVH